MAAQPSDRSESSVPERTWDGLPVAVEPPHGAAILVWRRGPVRDGVAGELEFLILYRAHLGVDFEGDWAWGPPAGAQLPGEDIEECARRELHEETGLILPCAQTDLGDEGWSIFVAEHRDGAELVLSEEHDRFLWVPAAGAVRMCLPSFVGEPLARAAALLRGLG